jgi:hypothetical protein
MNIRKKVRSSALLMSLAAFSIATGDVSAQTSAPAAPKKTTSTKKLSVPVPTPYYGAYHPPVVVTSYNTGCYNCGGWAVAGAAVTGVVVGAAVANANNSANAANAYTQGVAGSTTSSANTAVAVANANAAAANANAAAAIAVNYSMGEIVATIPAGCAVPVVSGITYYLYGDTWFKPAYGANGLYYRVVTTP